RRGPSSSSGSRSTSGMPTSTSTPSTGRSGASAASLAPFLLCDELAVARRVLEGGEADRRGAPPPRAAPAGRDRGRRAHERAEDERPDAAAPAVLLHGGIVSSAACRA